MGQERRDHSHRLYLWWLAAVTPVVRLWFGISRAAGWQQAGPRRRALVALGVLAAATFGAGVTLAFTGAGQPGLAQGTTPLPAAAANRAHAAAWIAEQVGPGVMVSCDPQMCQQVRQSGFPAASLTVVPARATGPFGAGVVVATPALQAQFGTRLAADYAPLVVASFGSGAAQVDVRVVAPHGPAAFQAQLTAEHARLLAAGKQLLSNTNLQVSSSARAALLAGQVDPRLLVTLSALASQSPLRLVAFDDPPPGSSSAVQLRGAEIGAGSVAGLSAMLAFLHAQQAPYLPAAAAIVRGAGGQSLVGVRFDEVGLEDVGGS